MQLQTYMQYLNACSWLTVDRHTVLDYKACDGPFWCPARRRKVSKDKRAVALFPLRHIYCLSAVCFMLNNVSQSHWPTQLNSRPILSGALFFLFKEEKRRHINNQNLSVQTSVGRTWQWGISKYDCLGN